MRGLHRELERHALILAESVAKSAEPLVETNSYRDLQRLVDRFKNGEQLAGIAIYGIGGDVLAISSGLKAHLDRLPSAALQSLEDGLTHQAFLDLGPDSMRVPMHVVALPLRSNLTVIGVLAVFHDTTYIDRQAAALWRRALVGVAIQTLLIGFITLLMIRWGFGRPLVRMTQWLREQRTGAPTGDLRISEPVEFEPLTREVTRLASSLVAARAAAENEARLRESAESNWTAERLRVFVQSRLGGDRLFAVSNREPYEHVHGQDGIRLRGSRQRPGDGAGTGPARLRWHLDRAGHRRRRPTKSWTNPAACAFHPNILSTRSRRVWLTPEEERGFYLGFANEGLWPLCHIAHTRPTFRVDDWEVYREVNHKFADAVLDEIADEAISGRVGAGLSLCAAAADDQATPTRCSRGDFLAYSLAQFRSVRHLPVAA